jgi:hypothetical protein
VKKGIPYRIPSWRRGLKVTPCWNSQVEKSKCYSLLKSQVWKGQRLLLEAPKEEKLKNYEELSKVAPLLEFLSGEMLKIAHC